MAHFSAQTPTGSAVQEIEDLVRTAIFKPANELIGFLLQSGMFWSTPGAEKILAFRCIHHSQSTAAFWKDRLNDLAAHNDSLPLAARWKKSVLHPPGESQDVCVCVAASLRVSEV